MVLFTNATTVMIRIHKTPKRLEPRAFNMSYKDKTKISPVNQLALANSLNKKNTPAMCHLHMQTDDKQTKIPSFLLALLTHDKKQQISDYLHYHIDALKEVAQGYQHTQANQANESNHFKKALYEHYRDEFITLDKEIKANSTQKNDLSDTGNILFARISYCFKLIDCINISTHLKELNHHISCLNQQMIRLALETKDTPSWQAFIYKATLNIYLPNLTSDYKTNCYLTTINQSISENDMFVYKLQIHLCWLYQSQSVPLCPDWLILVTKIRACANDWRLIYSLLDTYMNHYDESMKDYPAYGLTENHYYTLMKARIDIIEIYKLQQPKSIFSFLRILWPQKKKLADYFDQPDQRLKNKKERLNQQPKIIAYRQYYNHQKISLLHKTCDHLLQTHLESNKLKTQENNHDIYDIENIILTDLSTLKRQCATLDRQVTVSMQKLKDIVQKNKPNKP